MNICYCNGCKEFVPPNEVEVLEEYHEGEFEDFHIGCGGKVTII